MEFLTDCFRAHLEGRPTPSLISTQPLIDTCVPQSLCHHPPVMIRHDNGSNWDSSIHAAEREIGTPTPRAMSADGSPHGISEKDGGCSGSFRLSTFRCPLFARSELFLKPGPGHSGWAWNRRHFRSDDDECAAYESDSR
jgi:hypothetical protein